MRRWVGRNSIHVIARSPCDEAIQDLSADAFLDCFAALAMTEFVDSAHFPRASNTWRDRGHGTRALLPTESGAHFARSFAGITSLRPDQTSLTAQILISTRPFASAVSRTSASVTSVATPEAF